MSWPSRYYERQLSQLYREEGAAVQWYQNGRTQRTDRVPRVCRRKAMGVFNLARQVHTFMMLEFVPVGATHESVVFDMEAMKTKVRALCFPVARHHPVLV